MTAMVIRTRASSTSSLPSLTHSLMPANACGPPSSSAPTKSYFRGGVVGVWDDAEASAVPNAGTALERGSPAKPLTAAA
jgi:hypothetical protein